MTARIKGGIDFCDQHMVAGWSDSFPVAVYLNGERCGAASETHDDRLAAENPGARRFDFTFPVPLWLNDRVTIRLADDSVLTPRHDVSHLPRLSMLVSPLDLSKAGLEFGPLHRPTIPRKHVDVAYVDHEDQESLKRRNAEDLGPDVDRIPVIDFIWAEGRTLLETTKGRRFAWIVASHVGEHIPDFIGWIQQVDAVLEMGGCLSLALPHGERSFDACRPVSTFQDLMAAHILRLERPSPSQVLNHFLGVSAYHKVDLTQPQHGAELLHAVTMARHGNEGAYIDIHCHVFTPASFAQCYAMIARCGFVRLALDTVIETNGEEFYVRLTKTVV
jgi:hypothetical protein